MYKEEPVCEVGKFQRGFHHLVVLLFHFPGGGSNLVITCEQGEVLQDRTNLCGRSGASTIVTALCGSIIHLGYIVVQGFHLGRENVDIGQQCIQLQVVNCSVSFKEKVGNQSVLHLLVKGGAPGKPLNHKIYE